MIKFALVADSHLGPEKFYEGQIRKLSRNTLPYLSQLRDELIALHKPSFVVQLGDLIEDSSSRQDDSSNYQLGLNCFDGLPMPAIHAVLLVDQKFHANMCQAPTHRDCVSHRHGHLLRPSMA